jgi:hypothetical protein
MRCSLRTCVACNTVSLPSEETKCYISEAGSSVQSICTVASLGTADLTATANLPVVIFGQCPDCSLLQHESQKEGVLSLRSIADVDILWLTQCCGFLDICAHLHMSRRWQNRCNDGWLLGRMITGICHRYQVTSYKCWISQVLLGVTSWDRVPNETNKPKSKRWMVLNVVYQYTLRFLSKRRNRQSAANWECGEGDVRKEIRARHWAGNLKFGKTEHVTDTLYWLHETHWNFRCNLRLC